MKLRNKILLLVASALLLVVFIFPIWSIHLKAPQYPEGLGLHIWVNKVQGAHYRNVETINDLNHYIGMKTITPDAIPELRIMPYVIAFLFVSGILIALFGNKKWLAAWVFVFGVMAIAGLVDFYLWEYNYGHHLNPNAPIKVPGMTYQPPLIGSKQLLNINATSLPHIGGYAVVLALIIGSYVLYDELRTRKKIRNIDKTA
ncbi:MAG TPA: hypothetical protein VJ991_02035 [Balneolales bacterium]|nr:hypothetical protein [Balneolales bacterium]